jgi:hypothetical protein
MDTAKILVPIVDRPPDEGYVIASLRPYVLCSA